MVKKQLKFHWILTALIGLSYFCFCPQLRAVDTTITLYGATGVSTVTPLFVFPSGTVKVYVEDVYVKDLTTNVEDSIALAVGEKLQYVCSAWDAITKIDINADKVSGDISGLVLPASLTYFSVNSTSVSGDISGWVLPAVLTIFYVNTNGVSGDISGWVLPADLVTFRLDNTSVSGDISGWILPASLATFYVYGTSVSGDISSWVLPASLVNLYVYSTNIRYDSSNLSRKRCRGAFTYLTTTLTKVDFDNCELTCDQVDNVLNDCVISQSLTNALDVGGTNAPPTINGLISKAILIKRGWTVSVTRGRSAPTLTSFDLYLMGGIVIPGVSGGQVIMIGEL